MAELADEVSRAFGDGVRVRPDLPNDIIFKEEFRQLAQENPNFNFYVTCTRLSAEDPWPGRRGRITAEWVKEQIEKEYQDILTNGGIAIPEAIPEGFGGFQ